MRQYDNAIGFDHWYVSCLRPTPFSLMQLPPESHPSDRTLIVLSWSSHRLLIFLSSSSHRPLIILSSSSHHPLIVLHILSFPFAFDSECLPIHWTHTTPIIQHLASLFTSTLTSLFKLSLLYLLQAVAHD
jgi:hypothetical protein